MGHYIHPILSLRSRHQLDQSTEIAWVLLEHFLQMFSPWSSQRCPALILGNSRTPWSGHSSPGQRAAPGWGYPSPARGEAGGHKGSRSCWWTASAGWTHSDHHHSRARQKSLLSRKYGSVLPRHVVVVIQIHGKEMIKTGWASLLGNTDYQVTWKVWPYIFHLIWKRKCHPVNHGYG